MLILPTACTPAPFACSAPDSSRRESPLGLAGQFPPLELGAAPLQRPSFHTPPAPQAQASGIPGGTMAQRGCCYTPSFNLHPLQSERLDTLTTAGAPGPRTEHGPQKRLRSPPVPPGLAPTSRLRQAPRSDWPGRAARAGGEAGAAHGRLPRKMGPRRWQRRGQGPASLPRSPCRRSKTLPFYVGISQFNVCLDQCQQLLKKRSQDFTCCDAAALQSLFSQHFSRVCTVLDSPFSRLLQVDFEHNVNLQ